MHVEAVQIALHQTTAEGVTAAGSLSTGRVRAVRHSSLILLASASSRVYCCRRHVHRAQSTASQMSLTGLCMAGALDAGYRSAPGSPAWLLLHSTAAHRWLQGAPSCQKSYHSWVWVCF